MMWVCTPSHEARWPCVTLTLVRRRCWTYVWMAATHGLIWAEPRVGAACGAGPAACPDGWGGWIHGRYNCHKWFLLTPLVISTTATSDLYKRHKLQQIRKLRIWSRSVIIGVWWGKNNHHNTHTTTTLSRKVIEFAAVPLYYKYGENCVSHVRLGVAPRVNSMASVVK